MTFGKDLESCKDIPIQLHWKKHMKDKVGMIVRGKSYILPESKVEDVGIGTIQTTDGLRPVLTFKEWALVPENHSTLRLQRGLNVEFSGAGSIKELCGKTHFVTDQGILMKSGENKLLYTAVSVDDIVS
jgi:hypothetical protein